MSQFFVKKVKVELVMEMEIEVQETFTQKMSLEALNAYTAAKALSQAKEILVTSGIGLQIESIKPLN